MKNEWVLGILAGLATIVAAVIQVKCSESSVPETTKTKQSAIQTQDSVTVPTAESVSAIEKIIDTLSAIIPEIRTEPGIAEVIRSELINFQSLVSATSQENSFKRSAVGSLLSGNIASTERQLISKIQQLVKEKKYSDAATLASALLSLNRMERNEEKKAGTERLFILIGQKATEDNFQARKEPNIVKQTNPPQISLLPSASVQTIQTPTANIASSQPTQTPQSTTIAIASPVPPMVRIQTPMAPTFVEFNGANLDSINRIVLSARSWIPNEPCKPYSSMRVKYNGVWQGNGVTIQSSTSIRLGVVFTEFTDPVGACQWTFQFFNESSSASRSVFVYNDFRRNTTQ